jgi:hypothetical protein
MKGQPNLLLVLLSKVSYTINLSKTANQLYLSDNAANNVFVQQTRLSILSSNCRCGNTIVVSSVCMTRFDICTSKKLVEKPW